MCPHNVSNRRTHSGLPTPSLRARTQVVYHLEMLTKPEGRYNGFRAVYEHYPLDGEPLTVLYDFACELSEYSLARELEAFRLVRFLIDRFHSDNHTCSSM